MSILLLIVGLGMGLFVGGWLGLGVAALGLLAAIAWFQLDERNER